LLSFLSLFSSVIHIIPAFPQITARPPTAAPPTAARVASPASNANKGCLVAKKVAIPTTTEATDATVPRIILLVLIL
jgi:hypothetical protein